MSLLRRLLRLHEEPIKYVTIALDVETHAILSRIAKHQGLSLEMWLGGLAARQVSPKDRHRHEAEGRRQDAVDTTLREMDLQDEMDELVARAERGEFTPEQWAEICRKYSRSPS